MTAAMITLFLLWLMPMAHQPLLRAFQKLREVMQSHNQVCLAGSVTICELFPS